MSQMCAQIYTLLKKFNFGYVTLLRYSVADMNTQSHLKRPTLCPTKSCKIKVPLNHNHVCTCNSHSDNTPPHCRHNSISGPSCNESIYYIGGQGFESLSFRCSKRKAGLDLSRVLFGEGLLSVSIRFEEEINKPVSASSTLVTLSSSISSAFSTFASAFPTVEVAMLTLE